MLLHMSPTIKPVEARGVRLATTGVLPDPTSVTMLPVGVKLALAVWAPPLKAKYIPVVPCGAAEVRMAVMVLWFTATMSRTACGADAGDSVTCVQMAVCGSEPVGEHDGELEHVMVDRTPLSDVVVMVLVPTLIAGRWSTTATCSVSAYCIVAVIDTATTAHLVPLPREVEVNSFELISILVVDGLFPCTRSVALGIRTHTVADWDAVAVPLVTKRFRETRTLPYEVRVPMYTP